MADTAARCVIILSARSSGSSAIQNLLVRSPGVRHVDRTPHYENETLFWNKAASVLGRPQVRMADSRLPYPKDVGRAMLRSLLVENIGPGYTPPADDERLVFEGWRDLCLHYAPVFVEKTPHHLHQWGTLELMLEGLARTPEVAPLVIGLVRNPMDTIYSMWQRWRGLPTHNQRDWLTAYTNLGRLGERLGERLLVVRYEDVVRQPALLDPAYAFMGRRPPQDYGLHADAIGKWRRDARFRFRLDDRVLALAEQYGYRREDMENSGSRLWPVYERASRIHILRVRPLVDRLRGDQRP